MDSSAAFSYVYAKASGMLAKSFSYKNAQKLFEAKSLGELWSLVFPNEEVPAVPETLLAKQIESRAQQKLIADYEKLLSCFEKPYEILTLLLKSYNVSGDFSFDIGAKEANERDKAYAKELFSSAKRISGDGSEEIKKTIAMEFSLKNILWALRLKVFYKMENDEILPLLAYSDDEAKGNDEFVKGAIDVLSRDIEKFDDWRDWKYSDCLNPNEDGEIWKIDPVWVERKMTTMLHEKERIFFHRYSSSVAALYSWFKIKETELDYIRMAAEGLRLGVEGENNV